LNSQPKGSPCQVKNMYQSEDKKYQRFFQAYNEQFASMCDLAISQYGRDTGREWAGGDGSLRNAVQNNMQEWFSRPFAPEYPGLTGDQLIDGLASPADAIKFAAFAAACCDDELPDPIRVKLGSFGPDIGEKILTSIDRSVWENDENRTVEDEQAVAIGAAFLKLLGDWENADGLAAVLDGFTALNQPDERIADAIRYYIVALDGQAILPVMDLIGQELERQQDLRPAAEYLLIALTDLGKTEPSDELFSCLRSCFRKMNHKTIGAICLGDYGDGRGIAVLKGWLDSHPEIRDRQLIGEILSSIRRLGGDISDLQHRLRL